jgi:ABC-type multidrug transport system fused ATPase/permease subunit
MSDSSSISTQSFIPWKPYPPFVTIEQEEALAQDVLPWIIFGVVASSLTLTFGLWTCWWIRRPRQKLPIEEGLEEDGVTPMDPFALEHALKKFNRKRFAALLVVFCVMLLFAALGTFVYYINNRAQQNVTLASVQVSANLSLFNFFIEVDREEWRRIDEEHSRWKNRKEDMELTSVSLLKLTSFMILFTSLATDSYNFVPNAEIKQSLHPLLQDIISANGTAGTFATDLQEGDDVRWRVALAIHSVAFIVLISLLIGALYPKAMPLFLILSPIVLVCLWIACSFNSMTANAIQFSCDQLDTMMSSYSSVNNTYNSTVEIIFECVSYGAISNSTQDKSGLSFALTTGNTTMVDLVGVLNQELNRNNIDAYGE